MARLRLVFPFALALVLAAAAAAQNLCVSGPLEDHIFDWTIGQPIPTYTFTLENCGDPNATIDWSVQAAGSLSNVTVITPASGTLQPGEGPITVDVTFDLVEAAPQLYAGAVRFFEGGSAVQSVIIKVTVLAPLTFDVGDVLLGDLASGGDSDGAVFTAVKGMKMKVAFKPGPASGLQVTLRISDAFGVPVSEWTSKPGKPLKKKLVFQQDGVFRLSVESLNGTTGTFKVKTGRKLPGKAKPRVTVLTQTATPAVLPDAVVLVLNGALISANVLPKGTVPPSQIDAELLDPDGGTVDTSDFKSESSVGVHFVNVPSDQTGAYSVQVSGLHAGQKVKVALMPFQPGQGASSQVDIDDEGGQS